MHMAKILSNGVNMGNMPNTLGNKPWMTWGEWPVSILYGPLTVIGLHIVNWI